MQRFTLIPDTESSPSFVQIDVLLPQLRKNANTLTHDLNDCEHRVKRLQIARTIQLVVSLGSKRTFVGFHVAEKFTASVILTYDICDHHVELIRTRMRIVDPLTEAKQYFQIKREDNL